MSAEATGWVYRHSPFKGAAFAVHLAIADTVSDLHGHLFWMAQANLATKARVTDRAARTAVAALIGAGMIECADASAADPEGRQRGGRPVRYRFLYPADAAIVYDARPRPRNDVPTPRNDVPGGSVPRSDVTQGEPNPSQASPADAENPTRASKARKTDPRSDPLTREWWDAQSPKPTWNYLAARGIVSTALKRGWAEDKVRAALATLPPPFTSGQLDYALRNPRRSIPAERGGTRGMTDADTGTVVAL